MEAGAKSLRGRSIEAIHEDPKAPHRGRWAKEGREVGIVPKHLHQLSADLLAHDKANVAEYNGMLKEARRQVAYWGGELGAKSQHKNLTGHANKGGDWTTVKGFDRVAEDVARQYPEFFEDRENPQDELWDKLALGNTKPMDEEDAYRAAFDQLHAHAVQDAVPFSL